MHALFNDVLGRAGGNSAPNDLSRVVIHQDELKAPIRPFERINGEYFFEQIDILQTICTINGAAYCFLFISN